VSTMTTLNTVFISHGAPDIILAPNPVVNAWHNYAQQRPCPDAIIVVSAHWMDEPVGITCGAELSTIYDFGGFAPELYHMKYPAKGDPKLSAKIQDCLQKQGFENQLHSRGLDHGAWIPLKMMYPDADIPIAQVSLPAGSLQDAARMGAALSTLRKQNILIIGSGGSVHNLSVLSRDNNTPAAWVEEFERWLLQSIEANHFDHLIAPERFAPNFPMAHPTIEHYAPLVVAWAAADTNQAGKRIHHAVTYTNLGMSMYEFGET